MCTNVVALRPFNFSVLNSKLRVQFVKLLLETSHSVERLARPVEAKFLFFLFGKLPLDVAFVKTLCERVHQQSGGDADVEALRESVHRNLDVHVGVFEGVVGETCLFGAENHGNRLVERERVGRVVVLMRTGCYDFVAFAVKQVKRFRRVELVHVVFVEVEPFRTADHNVRIDVVNPLVLNDMNVLNARQVAASQHRARVVRLVDVLQNDGDVACSVFQNLLESLFPFLRDES